MHEREIKKKEGRESFNSFLLFWLLNSAHYNWWVLFTHQVGEATEDSF
jgi:hypothetical protein